MAKNIAIYKATVDSDELNQLRSVLESKNDLSKVLESSNVLSAPLINLNITSVLKISIFFLLNAKIGSF